MVKKLTIAELAEMLNVSTTAVYKKVLKQGFETVKERVGSREITFVLLEEDRLEQLIDESRVNRELYRTGYKQVGEQFETTTVGYKTSEEPMDKGSMTELVLTIQNSMAQQFENYSKQLAEYALKAGKYELLEDKSKQMNDDIKLWQTEYFRMQYANESLIKRNKELEEENKILKEQLEKKSGLFGLFKK